MNGINGAGYAAFSTSTQSFALGKHSVGPKIGNEEENARPGKRCI